MIASHFPRIARLHSNRQGTVAVVFSLAIIPMITLFGLAMNYAEVSERRIAYQRIADAAALAGATASATDSDTARQTRAINWFNTQITAQNLPSASATATVINGTVVVNASASMNLNFARLYPADWTIKVSATAQLATTVVRRVLDAVFCIDATGSMQNTINSVKARATSFSDDLNNALVARGYEKFDYTRIRTVFYRDFAVDNDKWTYYWGYGWYKNPKAMVKSDFFDQPVKKNDLKNFIATENADGGGDLPESGYECIHEGMKSSWFDKKNKIPGTQYNPDEIYPVIVLWTDADALPFNHSASVNSGQYPSDMPRSATSFTSKWNNAAVIDQTNRMLAMFGPCSNSSWSTARALTGYMCAGTLNDGNTNMINKIADAMTSRYKNLNARLTH